MGGGGCQFERGLFVVLLQHAAIQALRSLRFKGLKVQCVRFTHPASGFHSLSSAPQTGALDWLQMLLRHVSTVAWRGQTGWVATGSYNPPLL